MKITLDSRTEAAEKDAAIRRVRRLQPVGKPCEKISLLPHLGERNYVLARL